MSHVKLKPIEEQVIVITGASSGIGLATAKLAAERGAKVVLAARSDETLAAIVNEIKRAGGEAIVLGRDARVDTARAAARRSRRTDCPRSG